MLNGDEVSCHVGLRYQSGDSSILGRDEVRTGALGGDVVPPNHGIGPAAAPLGPHGDGPRSQTNPESSGMNNRNDAKADRRRCSPTLSCDAGRCPVKVAPSGGSSEASEKGRSKKRSRMGSIAHTARRDGAGWSDRSGRHHSTISRRNVDDASRPLPIPSRQSKRPSVAAAQRASASSRRPAGA